MRLITHVLLPVPVRLAALTTLLLLSTAISGCLNVPVEECEGVDCFPLDSDTLSEILENPGAFDGLALSVDNNRLRIVTTTTLESSGQIT